MCLYPFLIFLSSSYDDKAFLFQELNILGLHYAPQILKQGGSKLKAYFSGTKSFGGPFLRSGELLPFSVPELYF